MNFSAVWGQNHYLKSLDRKFMQDQIQRRLIIKTSSTKEESGEQMGKN